MSCAAEFVTNGYCSDVLAKDLSCTIPFPVKLLKTIHSF